MPPGVPAYFASVLRALGYRVRLHLVPFGSITASMWKGFQISTDGDWADRRLTNAAAWVPTVSDRDVEVTSRRLGN